MKNKNIGVSFIPTELSIDEIIDSDIYFGKKLLKEIIKVVRLNRGTINIEIMEIIQLLQIGEVTLSKQKLNELKSGISQEDKNKLLDKINLHLGIE
jgi:hypothetical protein